MDCMNGNKDEVVLRFNVLMDDLDNLNGSSACRSYTCRMSSLLILFP